MDFNVFSTAQGHIRTFSDSNSAFFIACWLERRTRDRKVASSNPGRSGGRFFFFLTPELTLCAGSYSVSVPPLVLPQWHVKDPSHSAKSAGGRLRLNMYTPLAQRSRSRLTVPLSRHSVGWEPIRKRAHTQLVREHLATVVSQLAEPLWTDPSIKSGISVRELIST